MLNTCMPYFYPYKLQERLVKRNSEKTTILIVDDDIDTLTVTGRSLQYAGFTVHAFADPLIALHHIQKDCKGFATRNEGYADDHV
jgi:PleD family two-component response regulator